jgi:hypothetical protein
MSSSIKKLFKCLKNILSVFPVGLNYVPLLALGVKLVDLILIVDYVYEFSIFQDVILELDKLLVLSHVCRLSHLLDLESVGVNREALVGQIRVEEPPKDHDLPLIHGKASQLTTLCVAARSLEEDQLPMGSAMEVVGGCKVQPLNGAQTRSVVNGARASYSINKRITQAAGRE